MDKKKLRDYFIEKRLKMSKDDKLIADNNIFERVINHDWFKESECILTYVSTKTEVDTRRLIEYSLGIEKTVAVPRCDVKGNMMKYYRINSFDDLEKSFFNILEPDRFCNEQLDFSNALCIVPGLSFDIKGYRLGYGRGYFDRFLNENPVRSIGLCYKSFLVDKLPVEEFDKAVDAVLTD